METGAIQEIFRDAVMTALILAAPILLISLGLGLLISILQAATQIHEQTITFVPKLLSIAVVLLILGPWMMTKLMDFTGRLFIVISNLP